MKKFAFAVVILSVVALSCRPAFVRKGLRDVSTERVRLEEARNHFMVLDTAQVRGVYKSYFAKIDSINKYFNDQYSDGAWKIMTEYGQIKEPLKEYLNSYPEISDEYQYSLQQLADLEYDLREKLISKEQYGMYIEKEREENGKLIVKSNLISENAVRNVNRYNTISPRIDSLIIVFKAGAK
ncbi:MAG: hypothetical protein CVU11_09695 [Bacteroidetes bacterium HGW-Bacteroidetes-6]|jgi:hypothetical protein|nr:MAG: hypothetical protein CVU11_09695 [Bacteroidetes bacterium HGW-Bacteroidetes-6]